MQMKARIILLTKSHALGTLGLRAGVVGANFAVMIGLTAALGLAGFGALMHVWSMALMASAVISLGGPLILLRRLSGGAGLRGWHIIAVTLAGPAGLALVALAIWQDMQWAAILFAAFMINLLTCLASIMRSFGSVQLSMVLRDAGPFTALGLAVLLGASGTQSVVWMAVLSMAMMACVACAWCVANRPPDTGADPPQGWFSPALWGTSVLGMLMAQIDLIIGGLFLAQADLGLYAFLRRIANLVALPVSVATWVSAKPIAAAFHQRDIKALQTASAQGSRIAWYPAMALCAVCLFGLIVGMGIPATGVTAAISMVFTLLLGGALVQAYFASSITVATLSDFAYLSVAARGLTIVAYTLAVFSSAGALTPTLNAAFYLAAVALGGATVWAVLWRHLGVDTSARVLWRGKGVRWKTS